MTDLMEPRAPEISEEKFSRFVKIQNQVGRENAVDYVAIAKEAGLTDMEGQEIMANYKAYSDRYPAALTAALVRTATSSKKLGSAGAGNKAAAPTRRLIKR